MRLSSLSLVAILIFSTLAFAQHTTSTPPPSPPPPPPPVSHTATSAPSSPAPISTPSAPHISSESNTAPSHVSSAPVSHSVPSESHGITPEHKISSDEKISSAPRVGEEDAREKTEKKGAEKPEPDLRRRVCLEGNCKEATKPASPDPDLRRRVCLNGECKCPAGQTASKEGCTPAVVSTQTVPCVSGSATPGCVDSAHACAAGQVWNGASCQANCSILDAQAQPLIAQLRSAHRDRDEACRQDPGGMACTETTNHYAAILSEYQNLLGGAALECRGLVPDPSSI